MAQNRKIYEVEISYIERVPAVLTFIADSFEEAELKVHEFMDDAVDDLEIQTITELS